MKVTVKLVVFYHTEEDEFRSYCPELAFSFIRGLSVAAVEFMFREDILLEDLKDRFWYRNLYMLGWQITEHSINPPTFTDEEAVQLTEQCFERKIEDYKLLNITVDVPEPTRRQDLSKFVGHDGRLLK